MKRKEQAIVVLFEALQRSKAFRASTNVHGVLSVKAVMTVLGCSRSTASRVIDYIACHAERHGMSFGRLFWIEYIGSGMKVLRWSTQALRHWFRHDVSDWVFGRYRAIMRENAGKVLQFERDEFREMLRWLDNE